MLTAHYDWKLVWLSIVIATCVAHTALDLAGRIASVSGRTRALWVVSGAASMGFGVWAMHYIGMLAYHLPTVVTYSLGWIAVSLLFAFCFSAVALFAISRKQLPVPSLAGCSLVMGACLAAMHYIGMHAMHLAGHAVYQPGVAALSVAIAVATSGATLRLTHTLRKANRPSKWARPVASVAMGLALAGMHYTGMAAVRFHQAAAMPAGHNLVSISSLEIVCIASVTFAVLGLTLGFVNHKVVKQQQLLLDSAFERWAPVIHASQDGLFDVDLVTGASYCSPRWWVMLGFASDDPPTIASWEQFLHPDEREEVVATEDRYLAGGKGSLEMHFRYHHCDGRWLWIFCRAQAVWDEQGKPLRLTGSYTDVTERVLHEERLRVSEARYRELFEYNPLPAWIYRTRDLRILDVNQAAINHYGWPRDEFLANTVAMVCTEGEAEIIEEELRASAFSHTRTKPLRHRRKNDSQIWVELCHHSLEFGGEPARLILTNDVTSRIDAENVLRQAHAEMEFLVTERTAELQTSEAKWRGLVEALPNFVSLTAPDGTFLYTSTQLEIYSGVSNSELLSTGLQQLVHPDDQAAIKAHFRVRNENRTQYEVEFRLRSKDGSYRWMLSRIRPIFRSSGVLSQWLHSTIDIDDQKRSKQRLEEAVAERTLALAEALDRAESAARIKSEFLATMSHEIRTPLNGVLGMTQLMLDTPLNPTQQNYLDTIRCSGETLLSIINDILDFSKMEAGKMELYEEEFDLPRVITYCLEMVAPAAAQKNLNVSLEMGEVMSTFVGDAGRLQQVLLNLLSNAVKFTAEGSVQLSVAADRQDSHLLHFSIRDTGIGLSPKQQANLFQAFTQADRSTTRRFGGSGLGLSIVKRLVELMGGQVGVVSQLGEGSMFWFSLLLHPVPSSPSSQAQAAPARAAPFKKGERFKNIFAGRNLRLLVADDVLINQRVAMGLLRRLGLDADVVCDGLAAVVAFERTAYDLILMDVQMPGMDGMDATRRIREMQRAAGAAAYRTPIIALTANVLADDRQKYAEAGMDDFVSKPIVEGALAEVLWRWLPHDEGQNYPIPGSAASDADINPLACSPSPAMKA